ncbi:MAG: TetR/AcrR family transcriptional regulator [Holdemanella sp.]|nr:TetR/AcrR family transcriptional regulator [Holdemanella sp.]
MNKFTRKRIIDAFTQLVSEYGYENVNVAMIIKRAEVGKTTFYRYFKDKRDVMFAHCQNLYDTALENKECHTFKDLSIILFRETENNMDILALLDTIGYDSYNDFLYKYMFKRGKEIIEKSWGRSLTKAEEFKVSMFSAGCAKILQEWACGKYHEMSAEQAGEIVSTWISDRYNVLLDDA